MRIGGRAQKTRDSSPIGKPGLLLPPLILCPTLCSPTTCKGSVQTLEVGRCPDTQMRLALGIWVCAHVCVLWGVFPSSSSSETIVVIVCKG